MTPRRQGAEELALDSRFQVLGELGRGAASRVLEVQDRLHNVRRALKVAVKRGQWRRFRTEYRRLCEIRHPHVIRAYDLGRTGSGRPYYTLELVRGSSLEAFSERGNVEVLALIAMQALDALATVHARGWVHRDVQPKNLLVASAGQAVLVRLVDAGLLAPAGRAAKPAGTLPYVAPEVARGETLDGRADLYSLGVVLYEGLVPQGTPRTIEDAARRLTQRPPRPADLNPLVPTGFSDFVMRLMDTDREARFHCAEDAAETLAATAGLKLGRGPARLLTERMLRGGAISHRDAEIQTVVEVARAVATSREGRMIVVSGARGVGKTPLLRELAMTLNLEGMRVMHFKAGREPGAPVPALLRAARALDPAGTEQLATADAELVASERLATGFASRVGWLLAQALSRLPTALLLDDCQYAEPIAQDVLSSLGGELRGVPLLLVCATEGGHPGRRAPLRAQQIKLQPFGGREAARLAASRLHGLKLPQPALDRLVQDSEGLPSLMERTLAQLLIDKTIVRQGHRYVFVGGRYRAARHHDAEGASRHLAQIRPELQGVLRAAAVLERRLDPATVGRVAQVSEAEAGSALAKLAHAGILSPGEAVDHPVYQFASHRLASAVYHQIPVEARRRCHELAAAALEADPSIRPRATELVEHLLKGSCDERAVQAAVEAGDRAVVLYADRRGIEYYARAYARLRGPEDPRAAPIAFKLGRAFERTGELERAAVWYQAAIRGSAPDGSRIEIEATLGLGGVSLARGFVAETEQYATRALSRLEQGPDGDLRATAQRLQALVMLQRGDTAGAQRQLLEALATLEQRQEQGKAVVVLLDLARLSKLRGELLAAVRYARRSLQSARAVGDASAVAEAFTVLGRGFLRAGRFRAARRAFSKGSRVARRSGDRLREASVLRETGNLLVRQGRLREAQQRYCRALDLARPLGARSDESAALQSIGVVRGRLGDYGAALIALEAAFELANSIGDMQIAARTALDLGHTRADVGDLVGAGEVIELAQKIIPALADRVAEAEGTLLHAWVRLLSGDQGPAAAAVDGIERLVAPLEDPANRARALVFAVRCALAVAPRSDAISLAERLAHEAAQGGLGDTKALARGLLGQALESANPSKAYRLVERAAQQARGAGLRPVEVEMLTWLGERLSSEGDHAFERLTRAMELVQQMASEMPQASVQTYLSRPGSRRLRQAFRVHYSRVFGPPRVF